jgi:hypothetical protein
MLITTKNTVTNPSHNHSARAYCAGDASLGLGSETDRLLMIKRKTRKNGTNMKSVIPNAPHPFR